jgi:hypothetical protein
MADELHLDEFQAYLFSEDRSLVTITGYLGDVRLLRSGLKSHPKNR